jgi:hypothetical protein
MDGAPREATGLSTASLIQMAALLGAAGLIGFFHAKQDWVPILDSANLIFHEAGHPLFELLGNTAGLYGGTLMQLLVPALIGIASNLA